MVLSVKKCVLEASLCCNLDTGIFGNKGLNKSIYFGGKKNNKRKQRHCPMCTV